MRLKRLPKIVVTLAAVVGIGAGVAGVTAASEPTAARPMAPIVGTWRVTATPDNPKIPAFHSTLAYAEGGVVIEATGKPFSPPHVADTSEGLGVWKMEGSTLHITFVKYNYDSSGNYAGTTTIVETDTLHGDTYQGHATATVAPVSGKTLSFGVESSGQRMAPPTDD